MESLQAGEPHDGSADRRFEELWREWRPRAAAYARAFGGLTAEDREDLAAEAVLRAWQARGRFDGGRPFAPWFFSIVRRLSLDALAKRRDLPLLPERLEVEVSPHPLAEDRLVRREEEAFARRFVEALPRRDRELASLVYGEGLGPSEAARVIGLPSGTAKWRLFEMRKALKRAWEREYGETR